MKESTYTDEQIVCYVRARYGKRMGHSVEMALGDERSPRFADHVRRSFSREMHEWEDDGA